MSFGFLFTTIFITNFLSISGSEESEILLKEYADNSKVKWNYTENISNTFNEGKLVIIPKIEKQFETSNPTPNQTNTPLLLNIIINLNIVGENDAKSRKYRKQHSRIRKDLKKADSKPQTTERVNFELEKNPETVVSEGLGNVFERIKLRMELQRKKRNIEYQSNEEAKTDTTNDKPNKIEDISRDEFPRMALLNEDKEVDVTKWLKNWKDILAVNPILSTDKPTKPEVEYIDEWKFSYRVTLYNPEEYNVSNFLCSGILVSSQWVLTSGFCELGDDVTFLIGVHSLPKNISDHNRYRVLKKVYSLRENLELIQMDRPVQWTFRPPDIRSLNMEEMEILISRGKCNLLSWMPVDIEKGVFELRHYPTLMLQSQNRRNPKKNCIEVSSAEPYGTSKKDIGSPVLCEGVVTGILLDVKENMMTLELLCPVLEWISFFTREGTYFEVTARKFTIRSGALSSIGRMENFTYLLVISTVLMTAW